MVAWNFWFQGSSVAETVSSDQKGYVVKDIPLSAHIFQHICGHTFMIIHIVYHTEYQQDLPDGVVLIGFWFKINCGFLRYRPLQLSLFASKITIARPQMVQYALYHECITPKFWSHGDHVPCCSSFKVLSMVQYVYYEYITWYDLYHTWISGFTTWFWTIAHVLNWLVL